jgi:TolB-like protein
LQLVGFQAVDLLSLFSELKRRNVIRVGIAYVVVAWLIAQVADLALDAFNAPDWVMQTILLLLALGLPLAVFFAWAFELTPDGIKKEKDVDRSASITRSGGRKLNALIVAVLIAAVGLLLAERSLLRPETAVMPAAERAATETTRSVAVLPFVNMSSDKENEYFADGLAEELLNQLAQIPDLQVAGRTSSFSFKDKNEDLRTIGSKLGVAHVLEGSVRRQGDKVRVTAQLIRAEDGYHLWSNSYDKTMDDVFVIQDDIAANVAAALKIVLDESSWQRMQQAGVRNVDAFVEFQKGQELSALAHGGSDLMEMLRKGNVHFDKAIEFVPDFAAAYWHKSDYFGHVLLEASSSDEEREAALRDLREVLDAAFRLSGDSPRRAFVDFDRVLFSDDWTPLRDRAEKALATTGCPEPTWIEIATGIGYAEAALEMWTRHQRCEPLAVTTPLKRSNATAWLGQAENALEILDEAEQLQGTNAWYAGTRQWVLLIQGRFDDALAIAPDIAGDQTFFGMSAEALPLALSGDIDGARAAMEKWQAQYGRNLRNEIEIHAALGDREQANRLAAELDARPGGPMMLLITAVYCACGAPFDLEATPNFRDRVTESGVAWPLDTLIRYPAKDW